MTDTDKDLLERAARAAGYVPDGVFGAGLLVLSGAKAMAFCPLTDDGDALRLAVELDLLGSPEFFHYRSLERFGRQDADDITATRRAIVRAAAALGDAK